MTQSKSSSLMLGLRLFTSFFRISLTVIGGGYAILAVADRIFSSARYRWTEEGEIVGKLPIIQTVPGLIAGNTAVYVGHKLAGRIGAVVALLGVALPSFMVFLGVSIYLPTVNTESHYISAALLGCRSALTGILAATLVRSASKNLSGVFGGTVALLTVVAELWLQVNPAVVILLAMSAGVFKVYLKERVTPRRFTGLGVIALLFLQYGALCFGGGYVLVPFYLKEFVGPNAPLLQIPTETFSNVMALTQVTPGPISVNAATFFGYRLCGVIGSVIATACLLLPSLVLMTIAIESLERWRTSRIVRGILVGARPASVGLLFSALYAFAGMSVWNAKGFDPLGTVLTLASALIFGFTGFPPVGIILGSAALASFVAIIV